MSRVRVCKREEECSEINISPLIDMVFILLIFFIVTTVFVEEDGLQVNTPELSPPQSDEEVLTFEVSKEFRIRVDGEVIRLDQVPGVIRGSNKGVNQNVSLKVARSVPAHFVVALIDLCQLEGIGNVSIGELVE